MSVVPVWRLFAYMDGDETGAHDERRLVAPWQLHHVLDWCSERGYDHIYFTRDRLERTRFEKQAAPDGITHSGLRGETDGDPTGDQGFVA